MTDHPITPPPELVQQWLHEAQRNGDPWAQATASRAAQWGADQEILACGNFLKQCAQWEEEDVTEFYNYRRPKPPSLKEEAFLALEALLGPTKGGTNAETIRRALEQLDD